MRNIFPKTGWNDNFISLFYRFSLGLEFSFELSFSLLSEVRQPAVHPLALPLLFLHRAVVRSLGETEVRVGDVGGGDLRGSRHVRHQGLGDPFSATRWTHAVQLAPAGGLGPVEVVGVVVQEVVEVVVLVVCGVD